MEKYFVHMWPDFGDALFWDDHGVCLGGCWGLSVYDYEHEKSINLSGIQGLKEWYRFFEDHESDMVLSNPFPNTPMSRWKEWWDDGLRIAGEIKNLLPDDVELYYMWQVPKSIWNKPIAKDNTKLFYIGCDGIPFLVP